MVMNRTNRAGFFTYPSGVLSKIAARFWYRPGTQITI